MNNKFLLQWKTQRQDFIFKRSLGQNFLQNPAIADKIVSFAANVTNIVEIGPGGGILTEKLLNTNFKNFKIIEKDEILYNFINEQLSNLYTKREDGFFIKDEFSKISLLHQDALSFSGFLPETTIVANLPYNISKRLLVNWVEDININKIIIMVQKEVAYSIFAKLSTKEYKVISIIIQLFFEGDIMFNLKPTSFFPVPRVFSSVIKLNRKNISLPSDFNYTEFIKYLSKIFLQRRKKISNILNKDLVVKNNINPDLRPENISPKEFLILFNNKVF
jgi:16S rRNA (adenine1518-N6/adenine1519-N6)-dimethyltransferase